ncbi:putative N6-adenine methyltransferase-domain-containing protein [Neurospora hispaniola]|uniref:Protein-lysine N-methyltransferase EFM5 n=1 Tax=Neurospora hispaniola TaxID=588809 RepID=A0AAJ0I0Q4_9PEZI|nr:putative N6-adenine methyltransferase-domain-containing protein [Neurospora hispaniola]
MACIIDKFSDDESDLELSTSTLDALKSFYAERDARAEQFAKLQAEAEERHALNVKLSMDAFTEDWNESQFWYSDETATFLAKQLLAGATPTTSIAVVSAPSVFVQLKNLLNSDAYKDKPKPKLTLLEHDNRFAVFADEFIFYDFAQPLKLPSHLKGAFDRVIVDPPFLSEDCQIKAALTVRWMLKSPQGNEEEEEEEEGREKGEKPKIIACTGERMETLVTEKLYKSYGLRTTTFEPKHARGLSNEFYCYANFEVKPEEGAGAETPEGKGWTLRELGWKEKEGAATAAAA